MRSIAFLGAGNMAKAIISGLMAAKHYEPEEILVYNHRQEPTLAQLEDETGITGTTELADVTEKAEIIVIAVPPAVVPDVLEELKSDLKETQVLVSIAAGVTLEQMEAVVGSQKIVRTMPNTPAVVGEGMTSLSPNDQVTEEELNEVKALFESFGKAEQVPEELVDTVVGVSGSSPAYTYVFIEALADGAVAEGMPREKAYEFAAQAVLGAAKMVLETKEHPGVLKDRVSTPGGSTIQAVKALEENGFRAAVIKAVEATVAKSRELS